MNLRCEACHEPERSCKNCAQQIAKRLTVVEHERDEFKLKMTEAGSLASGAVASEVAAQAEALDSAQVVERLTLERDKLQHELARMEKRNASLSECNAEQGKIIDSLTEQVEWERAKRQGAQLERDDMGAKLFDQTMAAKQSGYEDGKREEHAKRKKAQVRAVRLAAKVGRQAQMLQHLNNEIAQDPHAKKHLAQKERGDAIRERNHERRLRKEAEASHALALHALREIKIRIHFIGMPQEPHFENGVPDWAKWIELLEKALAAETPAAARLLKIEEAAEVLNQIELMRKSKREAGEAYGWLEDFSRAAGDVCRAVRGEEEKT